MAEVPSASNISIKVKAAPLLPARDRCRTTGLGTVLARVDIFTA